MVNTIRSPVWINENERRHGNGASKTVHDSVLACCTKYLYLKVKTNGGPKIFLLCGVGNGQFKKSNNKIEFFRYYLRSFSNLVGAVAPALLHLGPPLF